MSKQQTYKLLGRILWSLIAMACVFLLFVSMRKKEQHTCKNVVVKIYADVGKVFLDENDVENILMQTPGTPTKLGGQPLSAINMAAMEKRLLQEEWISDVNVFIDNNQNLVVEVWERVPVARVFDVKGKSYYLDSAASQLPLTDNERADVPVFTSVPVAKGDSSLGMEIHREVVKLARLIQHDDFWRAQAAQIDISPTGVYEIYPAIGSQVIELGKAENSEDKLRRLKLFYSQVMARQNFNQYSRLIASYNNQIIAVKGKDEPVKADKQKALEVFKNLVEENKNVVNANAIESPQSAGRIVTVADSGAAAPAKKSPPREATPKPPPTPTAIPQPAIQKADTIKRVPKAVMPSKTD